MISMMVNETCVAQPGSRRNNVKILQPEFKNKLVAATDDKCFTVY